MIEVYIWDFQGKRAAWGHVAMKVKTYYISWWPSGDGQIPKVSSNRNGFNRVNHLLQDYGFPLDDIYTAHPIRNRTFKDDVHDEAKNPDHTIYLYGLNEEQIIKWWIYTSIWADPKLHGPPSYPWNSLDWNCAKVVATALKEGGGDDYSNWISSWNIIWTPEKTKQYANSIQVGLAKKVAKCI